MEDVLLSIISSAVWDALKGVFKITTGGLKRRLSDLVLDDTKIEEIRKYIEESVQRYQKTQETISQETIHSDLINDRNISKLILINNEANN